MESPFVAEKNLISKSKDPLKPNNTFAKHLPSVILFT